MAHLIGIAGGTCAGKSALAHTLAERLEGVSVDIDSYYIDQSALPAEERERLNYDEPTKIDLPLLLDHLRRLLSGQTITKPRYSFEAHTRVGAEMLRPARVILVDGLFALWWEPVRALFDLKIFVDAPADLRLARRIRRDITERGRTVESVLSQYFAAARPMHERYVEPTRAHADLVVTGDGSIQDSVERVTAAARGLESNTCVPHRP